MGKLIVPITKSPHPRGRIGPEYLQDWYRGLVKAKKILDESPEDSRILVVSAFHVVGEESEMSLYTRVLRKLGVPEQKIVLIPRGFETIEMMEVARVHANNFKYDLHFISTETHLARVKWISRGWGAVHHVAWGIPRPYEAATDLLLTPGFPILDLLGLGEYFRSRTVARRMSGKF